MLVRPIVPGPGRSKSQRDFGGKSRNSWWLLDAAILHRILSLLSVRHRNAAGSNEGSVGRADLRGGVGSKSMVVKLRRVIGRDAFVGSPHSQLSNDVTNDGKGELKKNEKPGRCWPYRTISGSRIDRRSD